MLSAPEKQTLTREAAQLHHPRIAPITLDFAKPLKLAGGLDFPRSPTAPGNKRCILILKETQSL